VVEILDDIEGKKDPREAIPLSKRLLLLSCLRLPHFRPGFYLHTFASHLSSIVDILEKLSSQVGFPVTLKALSQDAVEAGHK